MIQVSHNYYLAAKARSPQILLDVWTTPRGRYVWSNVYPSQTLINFFGAVNFWNGVDQTLGDGQTWGGIPVCEYDQRILNAGDVEFSLVPSQGRLLVSLGQAERGAISIEYDNSDNYFSELWGDARDEVFLCQRRDLYHGFVGLDPEDFVKLPTSEITQLRYTRERAIVVSEMQSRVYVSLTPGVTMTVYALGMEQGGGGPA